jgi:hypothetical protein
MMVGGVPMLADGVCEEEAALDGRKVGDEDDQRDHPRRGWWMSELGLGQSRVSSATAFLAQSSSTSALPAVVAAMRAAVAALLNARGRPRLAVWRRAMASSANYPEPRIMPSLTAA